MSRLWQFCWLPTSSLCQERFKRSDVWERYGARDGWIDEKLWSMRLRNSVVHKVVMLSRVSNSRKLGPKGRRSPYMYADLRSDLCISKFKPHLLLYISYSCLQMIAMPLLYNESSCYVLYDIFVFLRALGHAEVFPDRNISTRCCAIEK